MYKVKFSRRARKEIAVSWNWYEDQQDELGNRFETAILKITEVLAQSPLQHAIKKEDFREVRLKDFPFFLIYQVNENRKTVTITSVFHVKRNPENKYKP